VREGVCERQRDRESVCMCVHESERDTHESESRERVRESVCERERERECVYVCGRETYESESP